MPPEPYGVKAAGFDVVTVAGTAGVSGAANGQASAGRFAHPWALATCPSGDLIVVDTDNHTVRRVTPSAHVTTVAGSAGQRGSIDGSGNAARFDFGHYGGGAACSADGTIFVSDVFNHTIRRVSSIGEVTTLAGVAGLQGSLDGTGSSARLTYPSHLALDAAGNLYVADGNHVVRRVSPSGAVATIAGAPGQPGTVNGRGSAARFRRPHGIAVDREGNVYIAEVDANVIRKITPSGVVSTLAGEAGTSGNVDGTGPAARFDFGCCGGGLGITPEGDLYVADRSNHTIRRVTRTGAVTTVAGSPGVSGSADGVGSVSRFYWPIAVAVDHAGNVIIVDTQNHTIRRGTP